MAYSPVAAIDRAAYRNDFSRHRATVGSINARDFTIKNDRHRWHSWRKMRRKSPRNPPPPHMTGSSLLGSVCPELQLHILFLQAIWLNAGKFDALNGSDPNFRHGSGIKQGIQLAFRQKALAVCQLAYGFASVDCLTGQRASSVVANFGAQRSGQSR